MWCRGARANGVIEGIGKESHRFRGKAETNPLVGRLATTWCEKWCGSGLAIQGETGLAVRVFGTTMPPKNVSGARFGRPSCVSEEAPSSRKVCVRVEGGRAARSSVRGGTWFRTRRISMRVWGDDRANETVRVDAIQKPHDDDCRSRQSGQRSSVLRRKPSEARFSSVATLSWPARIKPSRGCPFNREVVSA